VPGWFVLETNTCSALARAVSDGKRGSGVAGRWAPLAGAALKRRSCRGSDDLDDSRRAIRAPLRDSSTLVFGVRLPMRSLLTNFFADDLCIVFRCATSAPGRWTSLRRRPKPRIARELSCALQGAIEAIKARNL